MTKISRNDLCPCGSGKKFKKCCGLPRRRISATVLKSGVRKVELSDSSLAKSLFARITPIDTGEHKRFSAVITDEMMSKSATVQKVEHVAEEEHVIEPLEEKKDHPESPQPL